MIPRHRQLVFLPGSFFLLAFALAGPPAAAQEVFSPHEELAFDRPEAWALNYFASVSLLSGFGPTAAAPAGTVTVGLEVGSVPRLDAEQRTVGFGGQKEEDLNNAPLFVRPRLAVSLPAELSLTVGYVPPVEAFGVKSSLLSLALERPLVQGRSVRVGARIYGQTGTAEGAFTCTADDASYGDDPERNPFGCEAASSDRATLRYAGFELSLAYAGERLGGLSPYVAAAINAFDNRFQVDALTFGFRDRTLLSVDGAAYSASAGLGTPVGERLRLAAEIYYSPLPVRRPGRSRETDALLNARFLLAYRLH